MIDLTRNVDDIGFAYRLASFMQYNDTLTTTRDMRGHFDDFPSSVTTYYGIGTRLNPAFFAAQLPSGVLILIAGASRFELMRATLESYSAPIDPVAQASCNPFFWSLAQSIKTDLLDAGFNLAGTVRIAGHSLGGCVAAALGWILSGNGTNPAVQVLTLGAPRMGVLDWLDKLETIRMERWFNDTDPISRVPFHPDESPMAYVVHSAATRRSWASYGNPRRGRSIDANGVITGQYEPIADMGPADGSCLNWIVSGVTGEQTVHSISEYIRRLSIASIAVTPAVTLRARAVANETPAIPLPPIAVMPPRYVPMPPAQIDRIITATRPSVAATVQAQDATRIPLRAIVRFRALKVSGDWAVVHGTAVVAIAAGKRDARAKARRWNAHLRADNPIAPGVPVAVAAIEEDLYEA